MTTFLEKTAPRLAIHVVVAPLTIYGLNRMFPAPNVGFLAIASVVALCTHATLSTLGQDYAEELADKYNISNSQLQRLNILSIGGLDILLSIFARYIGQRMGIQVPDYLRTEAYFGLAACASWNVKVIYDILDEAYSSYYYPKPPII